MFANLPPTSDCEVESRKPFPTYLFSGVGFKAIESGRSSAWLERLLWEQEVARSNRVAPTRKARFFLPEKPGCLYSRADLPRVPLAELREQIRDPVDVHPKSWRIAWPLASSSPLRRPMEQSGVAFSAGETFSAHGIQLTQTHARIADPDRWVDADPTDGPSSPRQKSSRRSMKRGIQAADGESNYDAMSHLL